MKRDDDDRLRALFGEIEPQEPSDGFEKALMTRVRRESAVRSWMYMLLLPVLGAAIMIGLFVFLLPYIAPDVELSSLQPKLGEASVKWEYAMVPGSVLLLLVADTLIRKRLRGKHGNG